MHFRFYPGFSEAARAVTTAAIVAALFSLLSCHSDKCQQSRRESGELVWPEITMTHKPWTRWWWPASAVQKADIDYMLEQYSEAGLGGMEVTTIYGAKGYEDRYLEYLSPEWMDLFTYTLDQARNHNLGVDLANASGWPFGGPWVDPEDACRYLATKHWTVGPGESLTDKVEYTERPMVRALGEKADISELSYPIATNDRLQQHAFEQVRYPLQLPLIAVLAYGPDGEMLELTDLVSGDGTLNWTAPQADGGQSSAGTDDWTVCALFLGWHGKLVERAGPGGEGDVIDHFNSRATENYLARFDEAFEGYDVSYIRYYFNDSYEVDDAVGNSDWNEDFFSEFASRRGYDLKPHMLELLGLAGDEDTQNRVVYDYRTTIGELLTEDYSLTWWRWANAQGKGIRNQAHGSPANILDLYAVSDVPETEGRSIIGMKTASSAAHVCDKPLTSSESATWLNEHFRSDLGDVREAMDVYLLSGVNHIFYHGTCMSPENAPWPGWMFYAAVHFEPSNSFWEDFSLLNKYVAHCQSFLQAGRPDNDVLLFFNATDQLSERGREQLLYHMNQHTPERSSIGETAGYLYNHGVAWDYVSDKMVQERLSVKGGSIMTAGGNSYSAIIIPRCEKMELETFSTLLSLVKKGATLLVEEELPADVPGLYNLQERRQELQSLTSSLKFESVDAVSVARYGKGRVMVGQNTDVMLEMAGVTRERMYDLGLQCISRVKDDGGRYYFVKNSSSEAVSEWVPLDVVAGSVGLYNPMTEDLGFGSVRTGADGKCEVFLRLQPGETVLLETFAGKYDGPAYNYYISDGDEVELAGPWNLTFVSGGPDLPAERVVDALGSWTEYGAAEERFSGTAEYSVVLPEIPESVPMWRLSLGDVRNSATVWLNGEMVGSVLAPGDLVYIDGAKMSAGGRLTVRVSNSMENRIAWMDRTGQPWRIFYNANVQARLPEDRGADGWFTAAGWSVVPSGLLGPVTLTPLRVFGVSE